MGPHSHSDGWMAVVICYGNCYIASDVLLLCFYLASHVFLSFHDEIFGRSIRVMIHIIYMSSLGHFIVFYPLCKPINWTFSNVVTRATPDEILPWLSASDLVCTTKRKLRTFTSRYRTKREHPASTTSHATLVDVAKIASTSGLAVAGDCRGDLSSTPFFRKTGVEHLGTLSAAKS